MKRQSGLARLLLPVLPLSVGLLALLTYLPPAHADDVGSQLQDLVARRASSIVTVKVVLKIGTGGAGDNSQESTTEIEGVLVTADGLVMISNRAISPDFSRMAGGGVEFSGLKITPQSFKVVLGADGKQYDAFLAATDTTLGLGFVKTQGVGDHPLPFVDFSQSARPQMGQTVAVVSRLLKGFDYAPLFETGRVSGAVTRPRPAWTVDGAISDLGLPAYSLTGDPLGVVTTIAPGVSDASDQAAMGLEMIMRLMGGGGGGVRTFLIPGSTIQTVVAQAVKQAVTVAAERAASHSKPVPPAAGAVGATNR